MLRREQPRLDDAAGTGSRIPATANDHLDLSRRAVGVEAMEASRGTEAEHGARAGEIECRLAPWPVVERMVSEAIDAPAERDEYPTSSEAVESMGRNVRVPRESVGDDPPPAGTDGRNGVFVVANAVISCHYSRLLSSRIRSGCSYAVISRTATTSFRRATGSCWSSVDAAAGAI